MALTVSTSACMSPLWKLGSPQWMSLIWAMRRGMSAMAIG